MNKFQREIELLIKRNDKLLEQELKKAYNQSIKELKFIVNDYMGKYADLSYSEKLQATRYYSLMLQIEDELDILNKKQENHIFHFLDSVGELGYNELFYDFEMSNNLNVNFTMLPKEILNTIIQTPVANFKLSERLKDGVIADLKGNLNEVLFRGFRNGWSYQKMAQQLVEKGNSSQKRALTIARTEGGRISAVTRQRSQEYAKNLGIETEKQWVSTLDGETRETHRKLDGQLQPIDGYFTVSGHKAKQPHMFGVAAEDVNCRCRTITIIKEYDYSERRDNITKKVSNYQNYDEWYKDKGFQEIEDKKLKNSYNKYKDILKSDMPTFDKFKEMKYNGGSEWEKLNDNYFVKSRLKDGRYGSVINLDKQAPHMKSTVIKGKSYFNDDVDIQELFDKYAGTGNVEINRNGRSNKEIIYAKEFEGIVVNQGIETRTNYFKIHYSKKRTHVVPYEGRK